MGQTVIQVNSHRQSALLQFLRQNYGKDYKIQEARICLEKEVKDNDVSNEFKVRSSGNERAFEKTFQLSDSDLFIATSMAVGIYKEPKLTGSYQRAGNSKIFHYPEPAVFSKAATSALVSEAEALEAIFNGYIGIKASTEEIVNKLDLQRYRVVPDTQKSSSTMPSYRGEQFVDFLMPIVFEGGNDNTISFTHCPGADISFAGGDTTTGTNILLFDLRGVIIRNGAKKITASELRASNIVV